ncbi:SIMPL domain-containing protein [Lysobacter sp. A3-1-A15]|uniref:SIMPL domain-containing protein n=1 Tax=Novilysobacter viscosus TaxID=3098602 RepID=UPI002ED7BCAF
MRKRFFAAALPLTLASAAAIAGTPLPDGPHVVVQGEGKVSVAPDAAVVTMVARHRAGNPGEAKRVVDSAVSALLEAAPGFEIAPDDITASDLALREAIDYDDSDRPLPPAHVASREVKVRIDDLDRLGAYMDAALSAGFTDVSDVSFKSSNEAALREQARARAVAEVREKAEGLAIAFGGTLGPVYSINSVNSTQAHGYGNTTLDRVQVTGSRLEGGRYLQPTLDFTERVSAVFGISR